MGGYCDSIFEFQQRFQNAIKTLIWFSRRNTQSTRHMSRPGQAFDYSH
jgi:hypothetical protein